MWRSSTTCVCENETHHRGYIRLDIVLEKASSFTCGSGSDQDSRAETQLSRV
jgi:hypothetical protein